MRTVHQALLQHAQSSPDAPALLGPDAQMWTYRELCLEIGKLLATWTVEGLKAGDRVAVCLEEGREMALAVLALTAAGAVVAPLAPNLPVLPTEKIQPVFTLGRALPGASPLTLRRGTKATTWQAPDQDANLLLLSTSGTDGAPKWVTLRHDQVAAASHAIARALQLEPGDRTLVAMPFLHIHGLSTMFASLVSGGSTVCPGPFQASVFVDAWRVTRPTWFSAAPSVHAVLLEAFREGSLRGQHGLRFVRSASSAMPPQLAQEWEGALGVPLLEAYGMTEASPQIASNGWSAGQRRAGSVGRPAGPEVAIWDEQGNGLPVGQQGEIAIRGANVAAPGWLRTGDLGYLDGDGFLFIVGRKKQVINRGGELIAPREVERVLAEHPAVQECAVFAVPHSLLGEAVAAAVVARDAVAPERLREHVASRLPLSRVPQDILLLASLPRLSPGKLDSRALLESWRAAGLPTNGGGDRGCLESQIAKIFAQVLKRDHVAPLDSFFGLGGHSLAAAQVLVRLARELNLEASLETLFTHPSARALTPHLSPCRAPTPGPAPGSTRVFPLSFGQERLWFLHRLASSSTAYTMSLRCEFRGPLRTDWLGQALNDLRERHQALRITFPQQQQARPCQSVAPHRRLSLAIEDLSMLPTAEREAAFEQAMADLLATPFDLEGGPLSRLRLFRWDPSRHTLVISIHHIVCDGWSMRVLAEDLAALYRRRAGGPEPDADLAQPQQQQMGEYAALQRSRLGGPEWNASLAYWQSLLEGAPSVLRLPTDRPRGLEPSRGASLPVLFPSNFSRRVRALAAARETTPFCVMMAGLQTLLGRLSGQQDFTLGTPVANRGHAHRERLVGFVANTVIVRAKLDGDPTFANLLASVTDQVRRSLSHQDFPFSRVVEAMQPARSPGLTPFVQVMLASQLPISASDSVELGEGLSMTRAPLLDQTSKFDLTLYLWEEEESLRGAWQFDAALLDRDTVERYHALLEGLLEDAFERPDARLSKLSCGPLSAPLETAWTGPPASSFMQQWKARVQSCPDGCALRQGDRSWTALELDREVESLARALRSHGVGDDTGLVALCLPRSADWVRAILAVWRLGAAYVPLDPTHPPVRRRDILERAGAGLLLSEPEFWPDGPHCLTMAGLAGSPSRELSVETPEGEDSAELAYLMFTSGSGGQPKGVRLSHAAVGHYAQAMAGALQMDAKDVYLHTASFAFSASVRQLVVPLASGGTLLLASEQHLRDPERLARAVAEQGATVVDLIPSYWRRMVPYLALMGSSPRRLLSASEPLPHQVADQMQRAFPGRVISMYGQTETTGIAMLWPSQPGLAQRGPWAPLGAPLPGLRVELRDVSGRLAPLGVPAELWFFGTTVLLGYLDPSLDAGRISQGWYRSGDMARLWPDGTLEFLGRVDRQGKVRGSLVEPAEVEAAILSLPEVADCCVDLCPEEGRLRAAVVPLRAPRDEESWLRSLRTELQRRLPAYLVPARMEAWSSLPRTVTGKVDLPAVGERLRGGTGSAAAPNLQGDSQEVMLGVWRRVLGHPRVGLDDNFFDLGGDSMLAVQLVFEARSEGLEVTLEDLFARQTVASLMRRQAPKLGLEAGVVMPWQQAGELARALLERAGLPPEGAARVAEVQLESSLRGQPTHNLGDLPRYLRRLRAGVLNPNPDLRFERRTDSFAVLDGDNGPGQWVASVAMEAALDMVARTRCAVVAVRRSNHLGALGHYAWLAARAGMIGLCTSNGPLILAPTGGVTPALGNNPIAVGIPLPGRDPLLLDMALSTAPRGRIGQHVAEGRPLPEGWILDSQGRPSTRLEDLTAGLGVPVGAHKGYGLALVMEILAGVLTGAGFGSDHRRRDRHDAGPASDIGHLFAVVDPDLLMAPTEREPRLSRLIEEMKGGERAPGIDEIWLPGERELQTRERSLREGVTLSASAYRSLRRSAQELGVPWPCEASLNEP